MRIVFEKCILQHNYEVHWTRSVHMSKRTDKRTDIITKLQEQIENIDQELQRLNEDKELYQQIILELTSDDDYDNISLQSLEYFVEERKERSLNNNTKPTAPKKHRNKLERQIALEKARAWSIDRKKEREKRNRK